MIISGTVQQGKKRGKDLGFPTINVHVSQNIKQGIYISEIKINQEKFPALTFIGNAKTFDEKHVLSETYILDFDKDIYGQNVSVQLIKKIRDNQKFSSPEELIEQMKNDEKKAREYFDLLTNA